MSGFTLDAGALIAIEKGDRRIVVSLIEALANEAPVTIPAGVLAQVWRGGARQARLASFLAVEGVEIESLDDAKARLSGRLCGLTQTRDIVDASVVVGAKIRGDVILTSDFDELRRLDPNIELVAV